MFSHIMVGSNDIARSKKFYDALFVAMGGQPGTEDARGRLAYTHNGGRFMVSKPIDGKPAAHANGGTIGFTMSDAKQADAWHKAGVANEDDRGPAWDPPRGRRADVSRLSSRSRWPQTVRASPYASLNCRSETEEDRPLRAVLARDRISGFGGDSGAKPRRPPAPRCSPASSR